MFPLILMAAAFAATEDRAVSGRDDIGKILTAGREMHAKAGNALFGDDMGVYICGLFYGKAGILHGDFLRLLRSQHVVIAAGGENTQQQCNQNQKRKDTFFNKKHSVCEFALL